MPDAIAAVKRPFCWLKIFQLVTELTAFGLYYHYNQEAFFTIAHNTEDYDAIDIRNKLTAAVTFGYPIFIGVLTLIALGVAGPSMENSVLCFLQTLVGCILYLTVGSMIAHHSTKYEDPYGDQSGVKSFSAVCIITSFLFLAEVAFTLIQRYKK